MSREDAEKLIKRFLEHKMLWFTDDGFADKYLIHQAMNIIGPEEVDKISKELKKEWDEE
jgi:hypothetical protein